jgi:hypothetical protein
MNCQGKSFKKITLGDFFVQEHKKKIFSTFFNAFNF